MAAGGLIAAAILTKSVAGLLPGVGVGLYLVVVGRWKRPLQSPWYMAAGALALGLGAAYFLLREHAAPGYLKAVMFNDVSGRFTSALDRHSGPPWYYLKDFFVDGAFSAGMLAAAAPLALISARGRERLGLIFSLCVTAGILAVLSVSATKLNHYGITACPFIAIFTAIGAHEGLEALGRANARGQVQVLTPRTAYVLLALVLGVIAARSAYARVSWLAQREVYPQASYGELFSELSARGMRSVRVVEGGVVRPVWRPMGWRATTPPSSTSTGCWPSLAAMDVVRIAPGALKLQTRSVGAGHLRSELIAPQLTATGREPDGHPRLRRCAAEIISPRAAGGGDRAKRGEGGVAADTASDWMPQQRRPPPPSRRLRRRATSPASQGRRRVTCS